VAVKRNGVTGVGSGDEMLPAVAQETGKRIAYVNSMEEIFPPGPGQALVKRLCTGCHRDASTFGKAQTREEFLRAIERSTETGPAPFPNVLALGRTIVDRRDKALIADYLVEHFGPGTPDRRLRVDPFVVDEEVASKAIYVGYDIPDDLTLEPSQGRRVGAPMIDGEFPQRTGLALHHLQAPALAPDGTVWFSSRVSNSLLRLDPKELDPAKRWTNYPIKGDHWVAVSGLAVDSKGHVYWSELNGGMVGELDPATGRQVRYVVPQQGVDVGIVVDRNDNVGFALIWGALFGRIDAATRTLHTYPTPTPDNGIYGLAADARGNLWGAGWQKGTISKWDASTESVREFPVPNAWGQIRRIGVDSKGMVWGSAYNVGLLVRLDPESGALTEYKIPMSGAMPYDAWPDRDDNIWTGDEVHGTVIKFDQMTHAFTFYPTPQPRQSVPKVEIENNNTIWFGSRNVPHPVGVHFYPNGYTVTAPPLP
jgi:streptogramin lyase